MSLKKKFLIAFLLLVTAVEVSAVTYEPLPNRPHWRGFHYYIDMADYPLLLNSNMPYEVLQGYIVADSAVRMMPGYNHMHHPIDDLNLFSDTAQYIFKYWYLLNEYDPLWFYAFLHMNYPEAETKPAVMHGILDDRMLMASHPKLPYLYSAYILHIKVNNTVHIDTADTTPLTTRWLDSDGNIVHSPSYVKVESGTIAYCKVLDTLKGNVFPSMDNAIFYNGERTGTEEDGVVSSNYIIPQQSDIVFSYDDQWRRWDNGPQFFDKNGEKWIKPNKEYIVFLEFLGRDGSNNKIYYSLFPYPLSGSRSMYPIEDGNVIDERNALGFGEKVPIEEFKQRVRDKINEIKSFGE